MTSYICIIFFWAIVGICNDVVATFVASYLFNYYYLLIISIGNLLLWN